MRWVALLAIPSLGCGLIASSTDTLDASANHPEDAGTPSSYVCHKSIALLLKSPYGAELPLTWSEALPDRWCNFSPSLAWRWSRSEGSCQDLKAVVSTFNDGIQYAYLYDSTGHLAAVIRWVDGIRECIASDLPTGQTPMLHYEFRSNPETPAGPGCEWVAGPEWSCNLDGGATD